MTTPDETAVYLRTSEWYGPLNKDAFIHRSWMKRGHPDDTFHGRPIIGICNSASELTPCNQHLDDVADYVKRGIWQAGGVPMEFPVTSLGETQLRPTAMLLRNLMAMDVEESIRCNPIDGVVLLAGCDKTTPAMVMGAASVDLPTIVVSAGPMLTGRHEGRTLGSGTDLWQMDEQVKANETTWEELGELESVMTRSAGTCNTMGTASTMAAMVESMGIALPGNGAIPASDHRRRRLAQLSGRQIVDLVQKDVKLSQLVLRESLENAIVMLAALGGSTNAVVHLLAIAGRIGIELTLDDFDRLGSNVPLLANIKPAGEFLMEDFFEAGGVPAVLAELDDLLHRDAPTVTGGPISEYWRDNKTWNRAVIAPTKSPFAANAGIAVLRGNLAPNGAVIKPAAASEHLLVHTGPALVFDSIEDYKAQIDDPELDVTVESVLVLRGCGPRGYPGMPEVGNMALPGKLLQQGVKDMVRISDARMSGTAYGTVVLHVAPESAAGGPLALVKTGDIVTLDVPNRTLHMDVTKEELALRSATWKKPQPRSERGWSKLYADHVTQADTGADMDFLVGSSGSHVPRESH